jgi:hypothetical protein
MLGWAVAQWENAYLGPKSPWIPFPVQRKGELSMVGHICNPTTWEAKTGGL